MSVEALIRTNGVCISCDNENLGVYALTQSTRLDHNDFLVVIKTITTHSARFRSSYRRQSLDEPVCRDLR